MQRHKIRLVDGMFHQKAIRTLEDGASVKLIPDPDNPRGPRTVTGVNSEGEILGYLDPKSWLIKAIVDDRIPVAARVRYIVGRQMRLPVQGVELEVITGKDALAVRAPKLVLNGPKLVSNGNVSAGVERPGLVDRFARPMIGAAVLIASVAYLALELF